MRTCPQRALRDINKHYKMKWPATGIVMQKSHETIADQIHDRLSLITDKQTEVTAHESL